MLVCRDKIINYIEKNGNMQQPYLINLIPIEVLHNLFVKKNEEAYILDFEKLKIVNDDDIIELIPKKYLDNLFIFCNQDYIETEKKNDDNFIITDLLNKKILNMVNDCYENKNFKYSITYLNGHSNRKFTYLDTIILRAIYNLWMKNIKVFTANQIYYELFQCHKQKVCIQNYVKDQINETVKYISTIMIDISFHDGSFACNDQLLCVEENKSNHSNIVFNLKREPILLSYAIMMKHIYYDKSNLYTFTLGRRSLNRLSIYMKILDFLIGVIRSKISQVMEINLDTIFSECNLQINSRSQRKKLVETMVEYLCYFRQYLYFDFKPCYNEKNSIISFKILNLNLRKKRCDKTYKTHKAIRQSKQKINEIYYEELQKKELESVLNSNSLDKNAFHEFDKQKEEEIMREYFSDYDFDFDIDF